MLSGLRKPSLLSGATMRLRITETGMNSLRSPRLLRTRLRSGTSDYFPFELVFSRPAMSPADIALVCQGFDEIVDLVNFTATVQQWLQSAGEIAVENVNKSHDKEAPRFDAERLPALIYGPGDLVLKWRPVSGRNNQDVSNIVDRTTSDLTTNWSSKLHIKPLTGKRKPYVVHVERLNNITKSLRTTKNY